MLYFFNLLFLFLFSFIINQLSLFFFLSVRRVLLETLVPKVHQVTRVQRAYEGDKGDLALMESWDRRYAFSDYLYICMLCQLHPLPSRFLLWSVSPIFFCFLLYSAVLLTRQGNEGRTGDSGAPGIPGRRVSEETTECTAAIS